MDRSLPERLHYLQPFRKKFASCRADELNEESGAPVLMPLLSKRLRGLSQPEAEQVLREDFETLQQWLSDNAQQNDPLQFVLGFGLIASPPDLARQIKEEGEKPEAHQVCLHMEFPPGAKLRRVPGSKEDSKVVTMKGLWLVIDAHPKETVAKAYDVRRRVLAPKTATVSEVIVAFGPVTGRKLIIEGDSWLGRTKHIIYALDVPGGSVLADLSPVSKKVDWGAWDESPFELCFQTLRLDEFTG